MSVRQLRKATKRNDDNVQHPRPAPKEKASSAHIDCNVELGDA